MTTTFGASSLPEHRPPRSCPVCSSDLVVTGCGCPECGTGITGAFRTCAYCGLSDDDLEMLRVFLVSRGNMRELERHLGVSYPTARQRFNELLGRLGLDEPIAHPDQVMHDLAAGRISVEEAQALLTGQ